MFLFEGTFQKGEGLKSMQKRFADLPGWVFEVTAVSDGAYRASARESTGKYVSVLGSDAYEAMERCREEVLNHFKMDGLRSTDTGSGEEEDPGENDEGQTNESKE